MCRAALPGRQRCARPSQGAVKRTSEVKPPDLVVRMQLASSGSLVISLVLGGALGLPTEAIPCEQDLSRRQYDEAQNQKATDQYPHRLGRASVSIGLP